MSKTTYEDQTRTIATLAAVNTKLKVTVKNLTDKIVTLSEKLAAAAKSSSQRGGAPPGFSSEAGDTGSAANLDGVFMPTKKSKYGKEFFVSKQFCPDNPKRKLELAEKALAKAKEEASK